MKPLKTSKTIELCLWIGVLLVLVSGIIYLTNGGTWHLGHITYSKNVNGKLAEAKREEIEIGNINELEMDLYDADVEIEFVEGNKLQIVESTNDKERRNLFEVRQMGNKILIERDIEQGIFNFGKISSYHLIKVNIPTSFKEKLVVNNSSGDLVVKNQMILQELEIATSSGDIVLADVEADTSRIEATSGCISIESIKGNSHMISTSSGDIMLKEGEGDFELASNSGSKKIGSIIGNKHHLTASSGGTSIDQIEGECSLEASSGSIRIKQLTSASSCEIETTSGEIILENLQGAGRINASSGEISIGQTILNGDLQIGSNSGDVSFSLDEKTSALVEVRTNSGEIEGNVPIDFEDRDNRHATMQIGKTTAYHVQIETSSGDVVINKK